MQAGPCQGGGNRFGFKFNDFLGPHLSIPFIHHTTSLDSEQLTPTMALPPSLQALSIGSLTAPNTLELFLDYLCPFSAKQLKGVNEHLLPLSSATLLSTKTRSASSFDPTPTLAL